MTDHESENNLNLVTVSNENFQNGADGWSNTADATQQYLGGYGNEIDGIDTQRNYELPENTREVTLQFDFLEIDSWDNESFIIEINGTQVELGIFHHQQASDIEANSFDAGNGTRSY